MNELWEGLVAVVALLFCVIPHEVAHGYVAWRLGDPTAKLSGRLSLNPIRHLDPIGSVLLPVALLLLRRFAGFPVVFGWAKPVPINPNHFRNPWRGMLWVGLAGPATNLLMALVAAGIGRGLIALGLTARWLLYFLGLIVLLSLVLALFNLIPVPPLDGSRVLAYFLPPRLRFQLVRLEQVGIVVVVVLLAVGALELVFQAAYSLWLELVGTRWILLSGLI
ncbi:MAG: Peptidase M50 [Acetothermia bacterium 64_32]|nr:MAG: Peptidase M50 [Acetothermia bacterium 64_32]HAF69887.1 site-2 protease family protein [Candidatus Acetothermia bacterium]